jgi:hypothetical protein
LTPIVRRALIAGLALVTVGAVAAAQRRGFRNRSPAVDQNIPYDGRFTFVRVRYIEYRGNGWAYDYPDMERNFMSVIRELTTLDAHAAESNILTFDDPELFKYPVAYVSEPGYWLPNDEEVEGLRQYFAKGGFVIFDDFMGVEWYNFKEQIRRVLPEAQVVKMDIKHPIFDAFFRIGTLQMTYPNNPRIQAEFWGIYEDNDPSQRLLAIINYNNDIGDYMEWTGSGWLPVNLTNDAYKFATNYVIYGLTH